MKTGEKQEMGRRRRQAHAERRPIYTHTHTHTSQLFILYFPIYRRRSRRCRASIVVVGRGHSTCRFNTLMKPILYHFVFRFFFPACARVHSSLSHFKEALKEQGGHNRSRSSC